MILMHANEVIRQRSAFLLYMIVLEMTPLKTFVSGAADRKTAERHHPFCQEQRQSILKSLCKSILANSYQTTFPA
jgi:hypothetical protein